MGYNIGIGNASIRYEADDDFISMTVEHAEHPDAPDLGKGDVSGKGNFRYPSYGGFQEFLDKNGLSDVFLDETDNMQGGHPGIAVLTQKKYDRVKKALEKYKKANPHAILPTPENTAHEEDFKEHKDSDYNLGRLVWFEFWMKWALENCKYPAISNS